MPEITTERNLYIIDPLAFDSGIFLSSTNVEPFANINLITTSQTIDENSLDVLEKEDDMYLIIDQDFNDIVIKVQNENYTGLSLWISDTDGMGDPIEYTKELDLGNITVPMGEDYGIFHLKYKWVVLNNLYMVKNLRYNATINIYQIA